jgi:hypothetical protein
MCLFFPNEDTGIGMSPEELITNLVSLFLHQCNLPLKSYIRVLWRSLEPRNSWLGLKDQRVWLVATLLALLVSDFIAVSLLPIAFMLLQSRLRQLRIPSQLSMFSVLQQMTPLSRFIAILEVIPSVGALKSRSF